MTNERSRFQSPAEQGDRGLPPSYSSVIPEVSDRLGDSGVLAVMMIDGEFLGSIERKHGHAAYLQAFGALARMVRQVACERLEENDMVVCGEVGRSEILLLLFRESSGARICRQELPGFDFALRELVQEEGSKAFYPFLRRPPRIMTGSAVAIRNPRFSVETQLFKVAQEARGDADLNTRIESRGRRKRFEEIILDRRVSSVYEPIVEVSSHVVMGYESLVRGPVGSEFHSPLALFNTAEEEDMVFELDCLCRASGLRGAIDFPSGTKLFLNVLPTSIHDPNFRAERLIATLEECKLSPSDVVLEISEKESIDNFKNFMEVRDYYRHLGFQFALDDTGSGYAGLEALVEISPEYVKMDRAFVSGVDQDPVRQDLLSALLTVAEKMGAKVVGEGLDTLEELEMLAELGIHYGQGWLFGRPTPLRAED